MKSFPNRIAMTLMELIVSLTITTIVLLIVFVFISEGTDNISDTIYQTELADDVFKLKHTINTITREGYSDFEILKDTQFGAGVDVLLLKTTNESDGYIFGLVDPHTKKLVPDSEYGIYSEKVLGYRKVSGQEIINLHSDISVIDDYEFYQDKLFNKLIIKDFQVDLYNSNTILDIVIHTIGFYNPVHEGETWDIINTEDFFEFNLSF